MRSAHLYLAPILGLMLGAAGCVGAAPVAKDPLVAVREQAALSSDGELVARWMLAEMLLPDGERARVVKARARIDKLKARGLYASIARAIDDEAHGRLRSAADSYVDALAAARRDESDDAPLFGWFAAHHLLAMRQSVQGLWTKAKPVVSPMLDDPGHLGWRARGELVEWWSLDGLREEAGRVGVAPLELSARRYGCVDRVRMAGPFGRGAPSDPREHFAAERPGPWPGRFDRDPRRLDEPRILKTEQRGCAVRATEPVQDGVFYAETFIELPAEREVIVAAQGAYAIFVDDAEVLTRDTRQWGIWPRFGARLRLSAGRHRVLVRMGTPETSLRVMDAHGVRLEATSSDDPAPPYAIRAPERLPDPNPLAPFLASLGVTPQPGTPRAKSMRDVHDPIARFIAADLAHVEGQDDVANVLIEPLVKETSRATGLSLAAHAMYLDKDPIYPESDARDLAKDVRAQAARKDMELWWPRMWLLLEQADRIGAAELAPKVMELGDHFREVPEILSAASSLYGKLGWKVERAAIVREAAARFADDVAIQRARMILEDEQGQTAEADTLATRIRELDPESEVDLERALDRRDYDAAMRELSRLGQLRKDRRDLTIRMSDLLARAGRSEESLERLERALDKSPTHSAGRLALADARLARGDRSALAKALVDAIQVGGNTAQLREAMELVDGMTELSPFRLDAKKVIADFEAANVELDGTGSRVLDYSAMWIHADGSARMLEHEIIAIQSREALQALAEQKIPAGLILRLRTVKKDGRVLLPEIVEGKPTVTMPHLEVGDYIETETVTTLPGDGRGGKRFEGPRWFFREEKLAYFRSEFIVVSPKSRSLDVETGGRVPAPIVTEDGALVTRHWRMDRTPAVPEEPGSAPIQEFLPNVRIGWGITLGDTLDRLIDSASHETPLDPRILRIATTIAAGDAGKPKPTADDKARRIYRWVLANVEPGRESDARRIITGKSGSRTEAFVYLCRLLGIDVALGLVKDRLTAPSTGPMSEAESFNALAMRTTTDKGATWITMRDKFAPYGYLPSSLRGQPVVLLRPGAPRETTSDAGARDGITHEGTARLRPDGTAVLELEQRYEGKFAIQLRTGLEQIADARLKDIIEGKLLQQALPGARLLSIEVKNQLNFDAPLTLKMKIEAPNFARRRGDTLVISPPFQVNLGSLASLPERETPLYLSEQIATKNTIKLHVELPDGAQVVTEMTPFTIGDGDREVHVNDRAEGHALWFDRDLDLPAGRVQPEAYGVFQAFARRGDEALHRDVIVELGGASASR